VSTSKPIFPSKTFILYARPTRERVAVELLADLAGASEVLPAFAFSMTNAVPTGVVPVMATLPSAVTLRMLPPDLDVLPETPSASPRYAFTKNIPPLTSTAKQAAHWLAAAMGPQVDGGATVLITPSPLLENTHGEIELRRILEWADTARSSKKTNGFPVVTGLAVGHHWLAKDDKRELLLNTLTDVPDPAFQLVVHWPAMGSYSQVGELAGLRGYRELLEVLAEDGREVIAGRNGLAGWMLAACGAAAYSAGVYPSHIYKDNPKIRRAKGSKSPPRIPHYLDHKLLSYIPLGRLAAVSTVSGPPDCGCADCQQLLAGGYQDRAAFRHLLRLNATLASQLASKTATRVFARGKVVAAQALLDDNPLQLPAAATAHLKVWQDVLA
jgi:hypothetical protein